MSGREHHDRQQPAEQWQPDKTRSMRRILTATEAARYLGYPAMTAAFYAYMRTIGIAPLPDRKGAYDRVAIDAALDRASGLVADNEYHAVSYGHPHLR